MSTPPLGRDPSAPSAGGPLHTVLLGTVARRFYLEGASKVEIADELRLSRFKVARLLDEARDAGLVHIEIRGHGDLDLDASARLADALGLRECLVVQTGALAAPEPGGRLGAAAAAYVTEILTDDDVLGLPWAREVWAMVRSLETLPPIDVVQLCGAQQSPDVDASAVEVVVRAARIAGTKGHVFYAPLIVDDEDTAEALRRQPSVQDALAQTHRVTRAVVGVGAWQRGASTIFDACSERERTAVLAAGAVGEISGVFFDREGGPVTTELANRIVNIDDEDFRRIPHVCGLVTGARKADAVRAAVAGGLLDSLVVDATLGRALLEGQGEGEG